MRTLTLLPRYVLVTAFAITPVALSAESTMKAVVIHEYGGPEVLKYEDVPRPEPKEDQILIRVIAAGVNPVDGMIRSGMFAKDGNRAFPIILGGGGSSADCRVDSVAGVDRHRQTERGQDGAHSWRLGRCRNFCHPNCQDAR